MWNTVYWSHFCLPVGFLSSVSSDVPPWLWCCWPMCHREPTNVPLLKQAIYFHWTLNASLFGKNTCFEPNMHDIDISGNNAPFSSHLRPHVAASSVCCLQIHRESFGICRGVRFRGLCHNIFLRTFRGLTFRFHLHQLQMACVQLMQIYYSFFFFFMNKCLAQHLP